MAAFTPQHPVRYVRQLLIATGVTCLLSQVATAADFYRWVDKKGSTHYTQTPPPQVTKKSVKKITVADDRPVVSQSNNVENDANVKKEASNNSNSVSTSMPPQSSRANAGDSTAAPVSSSSDSVPR